MHRSLPLLFLIGILGCGEETSTTVTPASNPSPSPAPTPTPTPTPTPGGNTVTVTVGPGGTTTFSPNRVSIHVGDTVMWNWASGPHTVTSGMPGAADGKFCSLPGGAAPSAAACNSTSYAQGAGFSFSETSAFMTPGSYPYYCTVHGAVMTGVVDVSP